MLSLHVDCTQSLDEIEAAEYARVRRERRRNIKWRYKYAAVKQARATEAYQFACFLYKQRNYRLASKWQSIADLHARAARYVMRMGPPYSWR